MSVVGIVNQKGGTGKSSTAVHLVYWFSLQGSVLLIDADLQQSSSVWLGHTELNIPCQSIINPEKLFEAVTELRGQYNFIVIDGPAGLNELTKAILDCVDLALVPCQPSGLDLSSSSKILQLIRHRQQIRQGLPKMGMFLSRASKGTILLREAQQLLSQDPRFPLLNQIIYQRQCIADAPVQDVTVYQMTGSAAKEASLDYDALFKEAIALE
ncbi:MAG: AAA family ATPase [Limnoraphis sp.]